VLKIGEDHLALAIADVTGKGVPAALYMAMSKALTGAAFSHSGLDPAVMMAAINEQLLKEPREAMSVTMLLAILNLETGAVSLACAGHEDPLLVTDGGTVSRVALEGGPPLGILPYDYPREGMALRRGETLLLITDGVTEAQDAGGALFGIQRLLAPGALQAESATSICEAVRTKVREYESGTEATDDLTVMSVRYLGPR
jgi:serine phosphatase RsbU (regulator of sigma subunit)